MRTARAHHADRSPSRREAVTRHVLRQVDPHLVQRLEQRLECRKPDHVMDRLGISLNTWDKLREGAPIRASVADRLISRFGDLLQEV